MVKYSRACHILAHFILCVMIIIGAKQKEEALMKRNWKVTFFIFTLVVTMVLISGCDLFIKTNDGHADLKWYMGLTYEDEEQNDIAYETSVGSQVAAVALEDRYSEDYGIMKDVDPYVNINTIKENIDKRFYWDKKENKLLFTNATTVYTALAGEAVIHGTTDEEVGYVVFLVENEKCYVNLKFVEKFVDFEYSVTKAEDEAPTIINLRYTSGEKTVFKTDSDIEMRTKGDYQNLIVKEIPEDTEVTLIEKGKNWNKVKTDSGYIGYIPVKELTDEQTKKISYENDDDTYAHTTLDKKVSLAWNQVYNQTANGNLDALIKNAKGVNVVSPTWFSLADKNGNLSTLADLDYVEKAHKKNLQVWALFNDFTDKKLTKTVLTKTELRQKLVRNIMFYVDGYDLDGVNIDFEYISEDIIDDYLQFLRELSIECRKTKTILSIDNYAPSEWSMYFDREQQLKLADYLIIMNYDEHTSASQEAGSVSSMTYAENSIKETIEQAKDASRIINGMPFYTRVWKETPQEDGDGSGTLIEDAANGNYYLSSEAVGMNTAEEAYKKAGVKPAFDETTGQNFVTYSKGKSTYSIWLEDETSVKARLELMNQYELGGAAYWALGQEKASIWNVISEYFK